MERETKREGKYTWRTKEKGEKEQTERERTYVERKSPNAR